jgi:hypothetical protein
MSVLVRTDPHATYDDVKIAHPDWIAVGVDGKPRRHWSSPEMWVTCCYGPYNFEFMTSVHREIMSRYRVDGLFINRWDGSGMCYCQHCVVNFKDATGFDLPRSTIEQGPPHRAYLLWRQERLISLLDVWNAEIRKFNPEAAVIPNNGSGALTPLNALETSSRAPMLAADRQARPWSCRAMAYWKDSNGVSRHDGRQACYRSLRGGPGGTVSVEGQRHQQCRDSHLGSGCYCQWYAPVVQQILRYSP